MYIDKKYIWQSTYHLQRPPDRRLELSRYPILLCSFCSSEFSTPETMRAFFLPSNCCIFFCCYVASHFSVTFFCSLENCIYISNSFDWMGWLQIMANPINSSSILFTQTLYILCIVNIQIGTPIHSQRKNTTHAHTQTHIHETERWERG